MTGLHYQPLAAASTKPPIHHLSHKHLLHPTPSNPTILCSGCGLQSSGAMYACLSCKHFILHQLCANLPAKITHPFHDVNCPLSLDTKGNKVFRCVACSRQGKGWHYKCNHTALHVTCASKPLETRNPSHVTCILNLTFENPYPEHYNGFLCDVCGHIGSNQWLYHCRKCEFDVHLDCTTISSRSHSVPAAGSSHHPTVHSRHIAEPYILLPGMGSAIAEPYTFLSGMGSAIAEPYTLGSAIESDLLLSACEFNPDHDFESIPYIDNVTVDPPFTTSDNS